MHKPWYIVVTLTLILSTAIVSGAELMKKDQRVYDILLNFIVTIAFSGAFVYLIS